MKLAGIRAEFFRISKHFARTPERVLEKFLVNMIFGIVASKSVNLSEISRVLEKESRTTARHIHKRIDRNLGNFDLSMIKGHFQAKQARQVDENTYLYFDPSEIVKPYGYRFEAISRVADGSDGHVVKNGYPIVTCVGLKKGELIPLDLDLFSYTEEEFESENQKVLWHMDSIANRTNRRGIFVLDRGFDRFSIIRHLHQNAINFIIRVTENRKYYLKGKPCQSFDRWDIINSHAEITAKALLTLKYKKKFEQFKFTIKAVPVDLVGGRIDSDKNLTLIRANSKKLTLYLLTNVQNLSKEAVIEVFKAYIGRWQVEEYIRFVKQQFNMEGLKVISLGRIKNIIRLIFMSVVVLTQFGDFRHKYSKLRSTLINKAKRTYKLPQKLKFFLYLIADGLAYILKNITEKIVRMTDKTPDRQIRLPLEEFS